MLPIQRFIDFIDQHQLFDTQSSILAAVSGGMDSVLLTHMLHAAGYHFGIAHCNFQLRADEAESDQQFCLQLAKQLDVPFYTVNFDTTAFASQHQLSIQMAARELRYQWFEQIRQQHHYQVTALAHHQNDAIETILLNLTRGTGIAGVHGILPKNGQLVRPLLFLGRDEVAEVVAQNNLSFVEDSSNASAKYARNKIRLEVIPKLKALNPALEKTFERNLQHFRDLEVLLEQKLSDLKRELFVYTGDELHIAIAGIKNLVPQRLLLFGLLRDFGFNETAVDDLISSLNKHSGRVFESENYRLLLDRERIILTPRSSQQAEPVEITDGESTVLWGPFKLGILPDDSPLIIKDNPMAVSVDQVLLIYPLRIRTWKQGDFFYPLGMNSKKKLSDFFINRKVPLHQKNDIPLLINGNGDVIWVGGFQLDDRYKVRNNTKKVTIFELFKLR